MRRLVLHSMKALFLSALIGLSTWSGTARADALADIIDSGVVRIGVPKDFPPFGAVAASGQLEGYDIDVATLLAKDLGVKLELVPVTSANRIPYLLTDKVDIVISSLGVNPERAKAIAFSTPYAPFFSGVFGAPDIDVREPADLRGKKVAVTRDTLEDIELAKIAPKDVEILRFEDNDATISAYLAGRTELIATGNLVAAALAKAHPGKRIERKFTIKDSPSSIGVPQGEANLLHWVNVFVFHKKLGGELDQLSRKWFGEPLPPLPIL
ncbi:MAG TPA: transporter substrate-binding domain-containing protein [Candidatus Competibacteraceae bacterium]|nr:transporter substrate-binding domain-containing protein [Candidatus Competibacteraceae bacterium]